MSRRFLKTRYSISRAPACVLATQRLFSVLKWPPPRSRKPPSPTSLSLLVWLSLSNPESTLLGTSLPSSKCVPAKVRIFVSVSIRGLELYAEKVPSLTLPLPPIPVISLRAPWSSSLYKFSAKLVLIAGNCPPLRKSELEYYAMLSKTTVHHFGGTNVALGTAAGKLFRVGCASSTPSFLLPRLP